MKGFFNFEHIS